MHPIAYVGYVYMGQLSPNFAQQFFKLVFFISILDFEFTTFIHRYVPHLWCVCLHENNLEIWRFFSTQRSIKYHKSDDCPFKFKALRGSRPFYGSISIVVLENNVKFRGTFNVSNCTPGPVLKCLWSSVRLPDCYKILHTSLFKWLVLHALNDFF